MYSVPIQLEFDIPLDKGALAKSITLYSLVNSNKKIYRLIKRYAMDNNVWVRER